MIAAPTLIEFPTATPERLVTKIWVDPIPTVCPEVIVVTKFGLTRLNELPAETPLTLETKSCVEPALTGLLIKTLNVEADVDPAPIVTYVLPIPVIAALDIDGETVIKDCKVSAGDTWLK